MTLTCTEASSLSIARPLGVLETGELEELEAHLSRCEPCGEHARDGARILLAETVAEPHDAPADSWERIRARLAESREALRAVPVSLSCTYCHGSLSREESIFCASCLAPCHADCFSKHGRCSAPGCDEVRFVRPSLVVARSKTRAKTDPKTVGKPSNRRARGIGGVVVAFGLGLGIAALSARSREPADAEVARVEPPKAPALEPPRTATPPPETRKEPVREPTKTAPVERKEPPPAPPAPPPSPPKAEPADPLAPIARGLEERHIHIFRDAKAGDWEIYRKTALGPPGSQAPWFVSRRVESSSGDEVCLADRGELVLGGSPTRTSPLPEETRRVKPKTASVATLVSVLAGLPHGPGLGEISLVEIMDERRKLGDRELSCARASFTTRQGTATTIKATLWLSPLVGDACVVALTLEWRFAAQPDLPVGYTLELMGHGPKGGTTWGKTREEVVAALAKETPAGPR